MPTASSAASPARAPSTTSCASATSTAWRPTPTACSIAGLDLAEAAWKHSGHDFDWEVGMDWYIVHQVSQVHTRLITERLGIDPARVPLTFPKYGNVGPAAIPITLASVQRSDRGRPACALHGHRLGAEHELHRNRLVTPRRTAARPVPGWAPVPPTTTQWTAWDLDPALVAIHRRHRSRRRRRIVGTCSTPRSPDPVATVVCVHGNPTWGYAWATFLRRFGATHRVIAVDQLGMGYSERTPHAPLRRRRVADLDDVIGALDIERRRAAVPRRPRLGRCDRHGLGGRPRRAARRDDPVQHRDRRSGGSVGPGDHPPGRLGAGMLELVCHGTPAFVEGTIRLSGDRLSAADRSAFRAPYKSAQARVAIADFVGDIPLKPGHPSERAIADGRRPARRDRPSRCCWRGVRATRCSTTTSPPTSRRGCRTPCCTASRTPTIS